MDKPPVMSMFATELDCIRARDQWFADRISTLEQQLAEYKEAMKVARGVIVTARNNLGPDRDCADETMWDYYTEALAAIEKLENKG